MPGQHGGQANGTAEAGDAKEALVSVKVKDLHPTQLDVGQFQVAYKRGRMQEKARSGKLDAYLRSHPVPAVRGPGGRLFMTDHHHLVCALLKNGVDRAYCTIKHDWSGLGEDEFWGEMKAHGYLWLEDEGNCLGVRQLVKRLPPDASGLSDDPYRSLAAFVRMGGGYSKTWEPFAEFKWADFFRRRLPQLGSEPDNPELVKEAMQAAAHSEAAHLPGYKSGCQKEVQ